jgi:RimJ/RimL family protein N-acetyltransferase
MPPDPAAPGAAALNPPLAGTLVRLEPLRPEHADALFHAARDPEAFRWIGDPIGATRERFDAFLAAALADDGPYATVDAATGEVVGSTRLMTWRPEHRGVEIGGTWLHPSRWRTGINVEAKLLMLEHAFERLGCQRVELKTHAGNERSRAAIAALGATFEGVHRKHMLLPGIGVRDSAWFSIVDDEWPAVRTRLCARLAAHGVDTVDR